MKKYALLLLIFVCALHWSVDYNLFQGRYIEDVKFVHDRDLAKKDADLKLILKTEKGTTFSIKSLNDDIKDLWDFGLFDNIRVDAEQGNIGIIITFILTDRIRLSSIFFKGNKNFSDKKLLEKSEISQDKNILPEFYDEYKITDGLKKIKAYYGDKGYFNMTVSHEIMFNEDDEAEVTISIEEGEKFFVTEIGIEGNDKFEASKIISESKIKKRAILSSGYYDEQKIEDGLNNIRAFYKKNGYISSEVSLGDTEINGNSIKLKILVTEGNPFKIGDMKIDLISDDSIIPPERIEASIKRFNNVPYSDEAVTDIISQVRALYTDQGYISVLVDSNKVFDLENNKVDLIIKIDQGEQAFINDINLKPLGADRLKTKPWVLLREMYVKEGDPFSVKKLQETQQKLYNLNYFDNIYPIYTQVPDSSQLDITWYAKEKPTGRAQIGGGYSNEEGLIGFVEVGESNFLGYGFKINLKYEHSAYREDFNLNFTDPWFLNPWVLKDQLSFGFDVYHLTYDRYELFYKELKNGVSVKLGKNFWKYFQILFEMRHDEIKLTVEDEYLKAAPADVISNLGWNITNAFSLSLVRDQRDYFFNPTKGSKFSLSTTLAGDFIEGKDKWYGLGGDAHYLKIVTQGEYYKPLFWKFVLGLRAQFGYIYSFSDQKLPPIYERFFLGGDYSVRGYNERSIGYTELAYARENWKWQYVIWSGGTARWVIIHPDGSYIDPYTGIRIDKETGKDLYEKVDSTYYPDYAVSYYPIGGTKLFIFNAEYKFPIYSKLWGALFYDAGYVWSDLYRDLDGNGVLEKVYSEPLSISNFKLVQSVGFGIRFEVPMLGVLRLDYGIGLSHPTNSEVGKNYSTTRLHFTIGNVF